MVGYSVVIKTEISNLVLTTYFWNNRHPVRPIKIYEKANNLKVFGTKKTKEHKQGSQKCCLTSSANMSYFFTKRPSWSYGSWIYNYLCNQCLPPLMLWVRISIRARCTTLCDKVWQWLATGLWISPGPPVSSTNKTDLHNITEILLRVALSTIKQKTKANQTVAIKKNSNDSRPNAHICTSSTNNDQKVHVKSYVTC